MKKIQTILVLLLFSELVFSTEAIDPLWSNVIEKAQQSENVYFGKVTSDTYDVKDSDDIKKIASVIVSYALTKNNTVIATLEYAESKGKNLDKDNQNVKPLLEASPFENGTQVIVSSLDNGGTVKRLGSDTYKGIECIKFQSIVEKEENDTNYIMDTIYWIDSKNMVPLKAETNIEELPHLKKMFILTEYTLYNNEYVVQARQAFEMEGSYLFIKFDMKTEKKFENYMLK